MAIDRSHDDTRAPAPEVWRRRLKVAEHARFEAEAKYEALMRQLPAAIYVYSPELDGPTFHISPFVEELLGVLARRLHRERRDLGRADPPR